MTAYFAWSGDFWGRSRETPVAIPYSQFQKLVREDKIARVVIDQDRVQGDFKEPIEGKRRFITNRVEPEIAKELDQHGVEYAGRIESTLIPMILSLTVHEWAHAFSARLLGDDTAVATRGTSASTRSPWARSLTIPQTGRVIASR